VTVDALECVMVDGEPTFPNLPRVPSGTPDWAKLGAEPRFGHITDRQGQRHKIDRRPTVPHPVTGEPIVPS